MDQRTSYLCTNCKYKFSRAKQVAFKYCPYCGKTGTVELDLPNKAARLLQDSGSFD